MTKHLRIRITEEQFRQLADVLVEEQMSKSSIIRAALHKYLVEYNQRKESQHNK